MINFVFMLNFDIKYDIVVCEQRPSQPSETLDNFNELLGNESMEIHARSRDQSGQTVQDRMQPSPPSPADQEEICIRRTSGDASVEIAKGQKEKWLRHQSFDMDRAISNMDKRHHKSFAQKLISRIDNSFKEFIQARPMPNTALSRLVNGDKFYYILILKYENLRI